MIIGHNQLFGQYSTAFKPVVTEAQGHLNIALFNHFIHLSFQARKQIHSKQQDGMMSTFRTIVRENGLMGLYRGLTPNIMKVAPAVSIGYVVYEHLKKWLGLAR